ncbi:CPCC family cysteine-rich protein [Rhodoligotrophos defluvii]|uniref:CPCC family cysteine-rich protein n=1 Tax=Rhodoligotrophos defluvii TaxID=2561934 RepID=UPI0010C9E03F
MTNQNLNPCPCCGTRVISKPGSYEICPICGWEDDPLQSEDPEFWGGANQLSLNQARAAWLARSKGS